MTQTLGRAQGMLSGFTTGQRAVIAVAVVALALGGFGLSKWASTPSMTVLYGNLSGTDASAVVEQLQAQGVQYELANGGTSVMVPQSQVDALRVGLAGKNLPAGDTGGWSLLDKQGMTSTDFQQNMAYQRAIEGELSKTLQAMTGVRTAIVHVAIPKKDVFTTGTDKPTASVLLSLQPGTTLSRVQVRSVTHLVAGSVPSLDVDHVTVSDAEGTLLSAPGKGEGGGGLKGQTGSENDEQTAQYEDRLAASAQAMLDKVLGPGRAVVRVSAALNFDSTETTTEAHTAKKPLVDSEKTASEEYTGGAGGTAAPLGVTWPTLAPGAGAAGGGNYVKKERTVDNAIDTTVTKAVLAPGTPKRITAAVVLDAKAAGALDEAQVRQLVANAIGIDPRRGDAVQVDKLAFDTTAAATAQKELEAAEAAQKQAGYLDLGTKAGLALLVLIALIVAVRRRSKAPRVDVMARDLPSDNAFLLAQEMQTAIAAGHLGGQPALTSQAEDAGRQRDRLRDEVSAFVDSQPDDIAQLVQGWLSQRKG